MVKYRGMEKEAKKQEYQGFIDHIIEVHKLCENSNGHKDLGSVCHLDVDEILSKVREDYKKRQTLVNQGIKHNVVSRHINNNIHSSTLSQPNRESLIMNSNNHNKNDNWKMNRGFLSMFA